MSRAEEAKQQIQDPAAFEHKDAPARGVLLFIAGLFITIAIVMAGAAWIWVLFRIQRERYSPFPLPEARQVPPSPRLQYAPALDMKRLRAEEDAILDTYGWVDRSKGIVRLPINVGMDLLAKQGLPTRSTQPGAPTAPATGAPSGGPQTGPPQPRGIPAGPGSRAGPEHRR